MGNGLFQIYPAPRHPCVHFLWGMAQIGCKCDCKPAWICADVLCVEWNLNNSLERLRLLFAKLCKCMAWGFWKIKSHFAILPTIPNVLWPTYIYMCVCMFLLVFLPVCMCVCCTHAKIKLWTLNSIILLELVDGTVKETEYFRKAENKRCKRKNMC